MTDDEALTWLRRRSCVVIFHEDHIVIAIPHQQFKARALRLHGFHIEMRAGYTLARSDDGDTLADVALAAKAAWLESHSPVDQLADGAGFSAPPVHLEFTSDF